MVVVGLCNLSSTLNCDFWPVLHHSLSPSVIIVESNANKQ